MSDFKFLSSVLSRTLILMPTRDVPSPETERFTLGPALSLGAQLLPQPAITDVAHSRNALAGRALEHLLRGAAGREVCWIFLLDDDQVVPALVIAQLAECVMRAEYQRKNVMVSALYRVRQEKNRAAGMPLQPREKPLVIHGGAAVGAGEAERVRLYPWSGGLGAAMMSAKTFRKLVETSEPIEERLVLREADGSETRCRIPAVCWSGVHPGVDGRRHWASEDAIWCERMRACCGGVYLAAHLRVGHLRVTREVLMPDEETDMCGLFEGDEQ